MHCARFRATRLAMGTHRPVRRWLLVLIAVVTAATPAFAAPPADTLVFGMHFSPVTRWLDPGEGESVITAFLLYYALHDGLVKPLPDHRLMP